MLIKRGKAPFITIVIAFTLNERLYQRAHSISTGYGVWARNLNGAIQRQLAIAVAKPTV